MARTIKKKEGAAEEIYKMINKLEPSQKLRLISRVAEDLSIKALLKKPRKPISSYKAFGMWKDREDMKDSVAWVRKLREKEEKRSYHE